MLLSLASDDLKENGRRHHPAGVGRGALDKVKEATMITAGWRLRRLAAMVGGELLGMTPGEDVGKEERERELVPPPLRKLPQIPL